MTDHGQSVRPVPGPENGYRGASYLRDTPFASVSEWRRAQIAAIPEAERCEKCKGDGRDVILASNGGVGEVVRCWPCEGTGRKTESSGVGRSDD